MIRTQHTQSVSDFRANYCQILQRLNATGDAEILTQNGEARAVMLSPKMFDQLVEDAELSRRAAMIRESIQRYERGEYRDGFEALDEMKRKIRDRHGA